jgi:hypothetical protein
MKKNIINLFIFGLFLTLVVSSSAQTVTVTVEPTTTTSSAETKEIQNLKDKIATKVAELQKENQKAIAGVVLSNKDGLVMLKSNDEIEYEVKIDDTLTKIYQIIGAQKKEVKFSDVKKDSYIIVTGPLIDKTVTANFIYLDEQYIVKAGKITDVNSDDYYIKVTTTEKDNYTLDIETTTTSQMLNIKTLTPEKIGFSKIKEGDTIHFVVRKTGKEEEPNRYSASKILIVPQEYFMK